MSEELEPQKTKPKRRGWRALRRLISVAATLCLFILLFPLAIAVVVQGQEEGEILSLPHVQKLAQRQLDQAGNGMSIEIGSSGVAKGESFLNPKVVLNDVVIWQDTGVPLVSLPSVVADSNILTGLGKSKNLGNLSLQRATLFLWRDKDGKFNFSTSDQGADSEYTRGFDEAIDGFFKLPIARNIKKFEIQDAVLNYVDSKLRKRFRMENGSVQMTSDGNEYALSSSFELQREQNDPTLLRFSGRRTKGDPISDITVKIDNAEPVQLANQVPALDWLRNIDADADASFVVALGPDARPTRVNGVLDLGAGRLRATPTNSAAAFDRAKAYFDFDAKTDALQFSDFELVTSLGTALGSAKVKMERDLSGQVSGGQLDLNVTQLSLTNEDVFEQDLNFESGAVVADVSFDPLQIKLQKGVLNHEGLSIIASGDMWARSDYWQSRFDLRLDQFSADQLKTLWPTAYIPKTRKWVVENVQAGLISDFNGFLTRQDGKADFEFKFAFSDVETGLVKTLAPLKDGNGEGSIDSSQLTLNLRSGNLTPVGGNTLDMAGSVFHVPDITVRPATGQISIAAKGDLKSALEVLNIEKFKFIDKFGKTTDVASGDAQVAGWLEMPLVKGVQKDNIKFEFNGTVSDVSSSNLIKGRSLKANSVDVRARDTGLLLAGKATLDGIPADFSWKQAFVDNPTGKSTLSSTLTLNQSNMKALNITLPKGTFTGSAPASFDVELTPNKPAKFKLASSLRGAGLNLGSLGWSKAKKSKANLAITGRLSEPLQVDDIRLDASGLSAQGKIDLKGDGSFKTAKFKKLKIGKWLSTSVSLVGQGSNAVTKLEGGTLDLRQFDIGGASSGNAGPLELSLDRLRLTDQISLTSFRAKIKRKGAPTGTFTARVNGGARISGVLSKGTRGTKITIKGKDTGAVLKSAGLFDNIREGSLTATIEPGAEKGVYVGRFETENFRMKHSNSMAKLLDAVSLVGLLQKMERSGIHFVKGKGGFEMRPEGVKLNEVSLVGLSIGISLKGWYASRTKTVDFDGVVTPIYAVNGAFERIAGKIFGRQKGEGLFSFVYTMKGPAAEPKVKVKPLSILTPGVFRQIFRQDIPPPKK